MSVEAPYLAMMPSTVMIYPSTATDAYGKQSFSATGVAARCRIQQTGQVVKTEDNRNVFEVGQLIMYGTPTIDTSSKIVLPDGSSPLILSIRVYNDELGAHHTTVSFGNS